MNLQKKPLVIFELANNHMGNLQYAKKIINEYYKLSLDYRNFGIEFAFKFQFRDLDTFIHPNFKNSDHDGVKRYERLPMISLNKKEFSHVKNKIYSIKKKLSKWKKNFLLEYEK